jgi:hypothetical protein
MGSQLSLLKGMQSPTSFQMQKNKNKMGIQIMPPFN